MKHLAPTASAPAGSPALSRPVRPLAPALVLGLVLGLGGCRQGGASASTQVGSGISVNPQTQELYVEESTHQGGQANMVRIQNIFWGRLVDVYDVAEDEPLFQDFVIGPDITTDGFDFELKRNPITEQESLVILHAFDESLPLSDPANAAFKQAFDRIEANLQPLLPKGLGINVAPPFSAVPRNAALVVVFDDLIDPTTIDATTLPLRTGNPPTTFFESRIFADPNHGSVAGGTFYPSRAVIDTTVTQIDAQQAPLNINTLGLPEAPVASQGNVSISIPTQTNAVVGQTKVIRNVSGHAVDFASNFPNDPSSLTGEVVRVFRSGMSTDQANGFLVDELPPRILGTQAVALSNVTPVDAGDLTKGYTVDVSFNTPGCAMDAAVGDVLRTTQVFAEVTAAKTQSSGQLTSLEVSVISGPLAALTTGPADFIAPYQGSAIDDPACFVRFNPPAGQQPMGDVSTTAQVLIQFSEPMDPDSLLAFDTFTVKPQDQTGLSPIETTVVGTVEPSSDLRTFRFEPRVPYKHAAAGTEGYDLTVAAGVTDLAGNPVVDALGTTSFTLDPNEPAADTGNLVLSFTSTDEDGDGLTELTGNFLFDLTDPNGRIRPRDVQRFSAVVDANRPIVAPMTQVASPIITPHVPLGSKMQTVWRIYEFGFGLLDPTTYDIDIEGLNWTPFGGSVQLDSFDDFEIRLTHSEFLPDEDLDAFLLPAYQNSGLLTTFDSNVLDLGEAPQVIVHPGDEGYVIQPLDVFPASTGTPNIPWPMNQNKPVSEFITYTWRDTSIQAVGGPNGKGADIGAYQTVTGDTTNNGVFGVDMVPTIGLPLLMEFRCQPDSSAFGQNGVTLAIAVNSSARPYFRVFSSGGFDTAGQPQTLDPETNSQANGGYGAAGNKTQPNDNSVIFGQADFVIRVSRMHTAWFDTKAAAGVTWGAPVVEPVTQPLGTSVTLAFRGATTINGQFGNADLIGAYGNSDGSAPMNGNINPVYLNSDSSWKSSLSALDGAQYVQMRVTFVSNIESLLGPRLSALGLSYTR